MRDKGGNNGNTDNMLMRYPSVSASHSRIALQCPGRKLVPQLARYVTESRLATEQKACSLLAAQYEAELCCVLQQHGYTRQARLGISALETRSSACTEPLRSLHQTTSLMISHTLDHNNDDNYD
eukprot:5198172-Amphidinium_carterae.1